MSDNENLVRKFLLAIETFVPSPALAEFFTADASQEEFPNRLFPSGRRNDVRAMKGASDKAVQMLSRQRYEVRRVVERGNEVAVEMEWTGVLKSAFGALSAGASLRAACAMFVTVRDGKIASIRNYDCYYP
jgi:ketosteroid isomerase-like protein